jgi:hypothetical protein
MCFSTSRTPIGEGIANRLPQPLKPMAGPCKLNPENGKADRNYDQRGAGRNDHDDTQYKNGTAKHCHSDSARRFVGQMNSSLDHTHPPGIVQRMLFVL